MDHYLVYEAARDAALSWPGKAAVYDEYGRLNFEELFIQIEELRLHLEAIGLRKGMAVGLKAKNGRNFVIGLFSIIGCGATAMPVYHQLKKVEIDALVQEAGLHVLLDDRSGPSYFGQADAAIEMNQESFFFNWIHTNAGTVFAPHVHLPACMRFTSGTTGKSKGVVVSHKSVIERIEAANKGLQLGPGDTVIWVLPMAYHFIVSVILYIKFGAAIAIVKDFLPANIINITEKYHGTLLYASPLQIRLLANHTGIQMMPTLKKIISTSAGISLDICQAFKKRFSKDVMQAYGIIEIGLPIINAGLSSESPEAVGQPLPDYSIVILDENDHELPRGQIGHLAIKGPGMFDAYLVPPRTREEVLTNGYFLTADFAVMGEDGTIRIEGRSKSVINISGIKIFPEEIEAILESIPEIKSARITSVPHHLLGQIIEGEIVLQEGAKVDLEEVMNYCRKRLSNFKSPQKLKIVSELPMTSTGKLRRD